MTKEELKTAISLKEEEITNKKSEIENFEIDKSEEEYDEWLDSLYEPYEIGYIKFSASRILSELDPIAYNCGKSDYEDTLDVTDEPEYQELEEELNTLEEELQDLEEELAEMEEEEN